MPAGNREDDARVAFCPGLLLSARCCPGLGVTFSPGDGLFRQSPLGMTLSPMIDPLGMTLSEPPTQGQISSVPLPWG